MKQKIRIAIFASGSGSNAENIIRYFKENAQIEVYSLLCNKPDAYVLERTRQFNIEQKVFNRSDFYQTDEIKSYLEWYHIDYIVLAGFLWLIPKNLIQSFPNRIINIHPALLPKYGGKGMYGAHIHQAVYADKATETGITIHLVNAHYDEGEIIFQEKVQLNENDTPETIASKIAVLEMKNFPPVIEKYIIQHQERGGKE